eukprot:9987126-Alexandrium_andersonii.AAC.1
MASLDARTGAYTPRGFGSSSPAATGRPLPVCSNCVSRARHRHPLPPPPRCSSALRGVGQWVPS